MQPWPCQSSFLLLKEPQPPHTYYYCTLKAGSGVQGSQSDDFPASNPLGVLVLGLRDSSSSSPAVFASPGLILKLMFLLICFSSVKFLYFLPLKKSLIAVLLQFTKCTRIIRKLWLVTAFVIISIIYFKTRCQAFGQTLLISLKFLFVQCLFTKRGIVSQRPVFDL